MHSVERSGLTFVRRLPEAERDVLTDDAIAFLAELVERFAPRRAGLLAARQQWQAKIDAGGLPDFRPDTAEIRAGDWHVAPLSPPLLDRRVEITGPAEPKMVINALNADVRVFMADFEDALAPGWDNVIGGQRTLRAALDRTLTYVDPASGKHYALGPTPATLMARVRGLHLDEAHIRWQGAPVPGALVDFGLYYFHNHQRTIDAGAGPYFYIPKLEHLEEAQWWDDVFTYAQTRLGQAVGTIRATLLIETLPAVFEMDEMLFALRRHAAALNCGRWDYIFSYIKTLRNHADRLLPDRHSVGMDQPFLDAYSRLLIRTCHRRGALAMGGMSAFIPRKDEDENRRVLERVRADKTREARNGHDGSWIAHPGLAAVVNEVYSAAFAPGAVNQRDVTRADDLPVNAAALLAPPSGPCTEAGVRSNIRVALQYIEAWLRGSGAVAIYGLMEDAATAEISRTSIWQWIRHGVALDTGAIMTRELFVSLLAEETVVVRNEVGAAMFDAGRFAAAGDLLEHLCTAPVCEAFLTVPAYRLLTEATLRAA